MTDESPSEARRHHDQLREEASNWFARMRSEDAERYRPEFEAWLARGAVHRAAYNRIGEVFSAAKVLKGDGVAAGTTFERHSRLSWPVLSAVLALGLGAAAFGEWRTFDGSETSWLRAEAPTAKVGFLSADAGVNRFRLSDGSGVILDVDSRLSPEIGGDTSIERLDRGRARLLVANRSTPRSVLAGPAEVISSGGTFDLWLREDGSVDAQVLSGSLMLRPAVVQGFVNARQEGLRLAVGQHARMARSGEIGREHDPIGTDWPRGVLEFRGTPLAEMVEEINRYAPVRIVLGDPALGARRISGRFQVDEPRVLARRLAAALGLTLDTRRSGLIVLRSR
jgi:transmembrane sensor